MIFLIKYAIIPAMLVFIDVYILKNQENSYEKYTKLGERIKVHPKIIKNFIGNIFKFSFIPYYLFITFGIFNYSTYIGITFDLVLAFVWHIKDVSGKPIDIILSNLTFSSKQLNGSCFMRFVIVMSCSAIVTGTIMMGIVEPITKNLYPTTEIVEEEKDVTKED